MTVRDCVMHVATYLHCGKRKRRSPSRKQAANRETVATKNFEADWGYGHQQRRFPEEPPQAQLRSQEMWPLAL